MATAAIKYIDTQIRARFPGVRGNVGVLACRPIATSSKWSQHAHRNATDYYGSPADLAALYTWLTANRHALGAATICYDHKGGCTTPHTDHLHVDATHITGTPACAGGTPTLPRPTRSSRDINPFKDGLGGAPQAAVDTIVGGAGAVGGAIVKPITATVDFLQLLTEGETWTRVLLFTSGGALILMGLAALLGSPVVDAVGALPGPTGAVAKVGKNLGGK